MNKYYFVLTFIVVFSCGEVNQTDDNQAAIDCETLLTTLDLEQSLSYDWEDVTVDRIGDYHNDIIIKYLDRSPGIITDWKEPLSYMMELFDYENKELNLSLDLNLFDYLNEREVGSDFQIGQFIEMSAHLQQLLEGLFDLVEQFDDVQTLVEKVNELNVSEGVENLVEKEKFMFDVACEITKHSYYLWAYENLCGLDYGKYLPVYIDGTKNNTGASSDGCPLQQNQDTWQQTWGRWLAVTLSGDIAAGVGAAAATYAMALKITAATGGSAAPLATGGFTVVTAVSAARGSVVSGVGASHFFRRE